MSKNPISIKTILEIQQYLNDISRVHKELPSVYPTGVYDEQSRAAVMAFQEFANLPVTGIVDFTTWEAMLKIHNQCLHNINAPSNLTCFPQDIAEYKTGDSGNFIYILQILLKNYKRKFVNYTEVPLTGIYDDMTEAAIRQFQQLSKLPVTGILDRKTWNTMNLINKTCKLYN